MRSDLPALSRSWLALARESARVAAATRVVSGMVLLLAMVVPAAISGTSGLSIEAQRAILHRVDEMGARTLTMVSTGQVAGAIPAAAVDRIARLDGVAWVLGLGPVSDVRNRRPTGQATPVRSYRAARAPVTFSSPLEDGGAFVSSASAARAGLGGAYSLLDPGSIPVVGWFHAAAPLDSLNDFVLIPSGDDGLRLERIIVAVEDVGWVDAVAGNLPSMVGSEAARATSVEHSSALLEARAAVQDEVARRDRLLVLASLGVAMALACAVVFAGTVAGRRDFGRRRALGATQPQLTLLVMLATLWPALIGAVIGSAAGWSYLGSRLGHLADPDFPVSLGVLAVLALVAASALPAAIAATRDPLSVLRVP